MARRMEQVCLHSVSQSVAYPSCGQILFVSFPRKKAKQSAQEKHFVVFLSLKSKQEQPVLALSHSSDHLEQGQPGQGMGGPRAPQHRAPAPEH